MRGFEDKATSDTDLAVEARQFQPDLLTIQRSPPSSWPRGLLLAVVAVLGGLMVWASFSKLDIIATAHGRLVPQTYVKVVQPSEPGVVLDVFVKDGDRVTAEQVLLRLDSRIARAEGLSLQKDSTLRRLTLKRIDAELNDRQLVFDVSDSIEFRAQIHSQYVARRQAYADAVSQEIELLKKTRSDKQVAEQTQRKLMQVLPIYEKSSIAYEKMLQEGFAGELLANEKRREYVERQHELKTQETAVEGLSFSIAASEKRLASIRSSYRSQLEAERVEILTQLNKIDKESENASIKSEAMEVKAPVAGVVKDLSAISRGVVVQAGTSLLNVVPDSEPMEAEVMLSNDDIGFVSVGQKVMLKYAAYPFQKFGLSEGVISHIGADAGDAKAVLNPRESDMAYRAIVRLNSQKLKAPNGRELPLQPGMIVAAEVHQGQRSVIEYLFSPIVKITAEAGRER